MNKVIDFFLNIIETASSRLSSWSWTKRWSDRTKGYGYRK
jgi:hypothetical protein